MTGNSGEIGDCGIESFGVTDGIAASDVDNNLFKFGNLHNVFIVKFLSESGNNFGFVFFKKSVQNKTSFLSDNFAAVFANAGIFIIDDFMSDAGRFIAGRANKLDFADVEGHFLRDDTALRSLETGFGMAFDFVDIFDDDLGFFGESGNNFALFAFIFAGEYNNGIAFFEI